MSTKEIMLEPPNAFNNFQGGWTAFDGVYNDPIPRTTQSSTEDDARNAAVAAWGDCWKNAICVDFDESYTN